MRTIGDQLNELVDACNAFENMTGGGLAKVAHTRHGCVVSVDPESVGQYAPGTSSAGGTVTTTTIAWAKAQAKWHNAVHNSSYVSAKLCTDKDGAGETGAAFAVYLPRAGGGDPNVRSGDVVGYVTDANGKKICVTDCLDDRIGTVKMWNLSASVIPGGWRKLQYTDYTTIRKYPRAATADGEVGDATGAANHTHTSHSVAAHTHTLKTVPIDPNYDSGGNSLNIPYAVSASAAATLAHSSADNVPLAFGVYFIERYE